MTFAKYVIKITPPVPRRRGWEEDDDSSVFHIKFKTHEGREEVYYTILHVYYTHTTHILHIYYTFTKYIHYRISNMQCQSSEYTHKVLTWTIARVLMEYCVSSTIWQQCTESPVYTCTHSCRLKVRV